MKQKPRVCLNRNLNNITSCNDTFYYLSSIKDNAWKLSYFHFFSFLLRFRYVIKCNQVTLINKKYTARKVLWKPKSCRLRYCNGTFPTHFFGNFQSNCSFERMFREEHYHMTLWNETPPPTFSEICSYFFRDSHFTKQLWATACKEAKFV